MSTESRQEALAVRELLSALVRYALADDDAALQDAGRAALAAHRTWRATHAENAAALDIDSLWASAVQDAESDARIRDGGTVSLTLPQTLPFEQAALNAETLQLDALRDRIRGSTANG